MEQAAASIEMPRYRSHKTVWALKIASVEYLATEPTTDEGQIVIVSFEDTRYEPRKINIGHKPMPHPGWYFVQYADGYVSFSPAAQFEEGNLPDTPQMARANPAPILRYFEYKHLPMTLKEVSYPIGELARQFDAILPDGPEKSAGLRKLLEAKDCLVRSKLDSPGANAATAPRVNIFERAARAAHEANRILCESQGDHSQAKWEDAPSWQRESAIMGVSMIVANPSTTPEQSHEGWLKQKVETGWKYGPVKDAGKKEHPCFVPYNELPEAQRAKDHMFGLVVRAALQI